MLEDVQVKSIPESMKSKPGNYVLPNIPAQQMSNEFAMGGSMPGATGSMYARIGAPSNFDGKKTVPSAQNGKLMSKLRKTENSINDWLGNPMDKAYDAADHASVTAFGKSNDPIDNYRHPMAGRYTSEAIQNKLGNIPVLSQAAGFLGANALGIGHELTTIVRDTRPWPTKLREAGEDAFNNMVGAAVGSTPFMSPKQKSKFLLDLSLNNKLPDGYGQGNMYIKKHQNGGEMKFYQNGLDFKPKSISKNGSKIIKDDMGQWAHPGKVTQIGSNQITMQGVPYPVLGISDTGDIQMMYPNQEYNYDGSSVIEYPMMAQGGQLTKLDQLTNFTNYNTKQPGGWLDKYQ
jgi:hypothetical protein